MTFRATGFWTLAVPGYFYQSFNEDDGGLQFWFGDRAIHLSSLSVGDEDRGASAEELLELSSDVIGKAPEIEFREGNVVGRATLTRDQDGAQEHWTLDGVVAATRTICIMHIRFADPAQREWAISTFKSVRHPGPDAQ